MSAAGRGARAGALALCAGLACGGETYTARGEVNMLASGEEFSCDHRRAHSEGANSWGAHSWGANRWGREPPGRGRAPRRDSR